jgi:CRISPR-associated protein Csc3
MSNDFDFLEGSFGFDEESDRTFTSTQRELLTLKLLREAGHVLDVWILQY